ncbi:hypothetical protein PS903_02249 [Pseudomonas fluorescens]|nr:hypothetical protein PS903_02249 [Pseudomonas fluorescens]
MSSWDQKSFRPSGKCQPTFSNDRTTVARPVHIPDYTYDEEPPRPELTKEIGLIFEWDNGEHLAPNISCHLSVGGETQVYGSLDGGKLFCRAPPGKYEAQLLENFDAQEKLREGRQKLKEALDKIIESEKEEAAKLQKIQEGRSDISNHAHLLLAVGRGYFHSAWGLVKSVKEVSDLVNPFTQLSNALTSAWTAKRADGKSWIQSYLDTYSEEQHRELAEALGFDYRKVTREQLAEAYNIACFIYDDAPSRQILEEFVKVYIEVQNPEEVAEFSGGVAFEIVLSALLIVVTGGVGLAARAALSARLLGLLKPLGEALQDLATFIVKATIKSAPRVKGVTGTGAVTVTIRRPKEIIPNEISSLPNTHPSPKLDNKLEREYPNTLNTEKKGIPASSLLAREGLRNDLANQAGIPRSLDTVWNSTIDQLAQRFEMDGASVTRGEPKSKSSGNAQIVEIGNSITGVKKIQHSPSTVKNVVKSTHIGEYYKFTYNDGSKIKIVDPNGYRLKFSPDFKPIYDKNTTYLNPEGEEIKFDTSSNKWIGK